MLFDPANELYFTERNKKKGVTKGSVVTYLGPGRKAFGKIFDQYGSVKWPQSQINKVN